MEFRGVSARKESGTFAYEEITGAAVVTFKVNVRGPQQTADQVVGRLGTDAVPSLSQVGTKSGPSRDQVEILRLCRQERTLVELMNASGRHNRTKFRPGKPRSRMQGYETTEAGLAMATGHASGRPLVSGSLAPDSGRKGGPSRTEKGKGR